MLPRRETGCKRAEDRRKTQAGDRRVTAHTRPFISRGRAMCPALQDGRQTLAKQKTLPSGGPSAERRATAPVRHTTPRAGSSAHSRGIHGSVGSSTLALSVPVGAGPHAATLWYGASCVSCDDTDKAGTAQLNAGGNIFKMPFFC